MKADHMPEDLDVLLEMIPGLIHDRDDDWLGIRRELLEMDRIESFPEGDWGEIMRMIVHLKRSWAKQALQKPEARQMRGNDGNSVLHWIAHEYEKLALSILEHQDWAEVKNPRDTTVAQVAGGRWRSGARKILTHRRLWELPSSLALPKPDILATLMVQIHKQHVMDLIWADPELLGEVVRQEESGRVVYKHLQSQDWWGEEKGLKQNQLGRQTFLALIQSGCPKLRQSMIRRLRQYRKPPQPAPTLP